ncbi:MerR family DNA-binding protein [Oricola indica]|uniref:MerR family DNA-binding protein n=1 Tax=Oricola indica TaxID=2872591 RepID=UPI001CBD2204|nr:MerR family DNA-binding protein [Oricola indica]
MANFTGCHSFAIAATFSLDAIRELLDLRDHPEQSRDEADAIARRRGRRCPGHRVGAVPRGLMPIKPSSSG